MMATIENMLNIAEGIGEGKRDMLQFRVTKRQAKLIEFILSSAALMEGLPSEDREWLKERAQYVKNKREGVKREKVIKEKRKAHRRRDWTGTIVYDSGK
jgi:hypothetical protein